MIFVFQMHNEHESAEVIAVNDSLQAGIDAVNKKLEEFGDAFFCDFLLVTGWLDGKLVSISNNNGQRSDHLSNYMIIEKFSYEEIMDNMKEYKE